MLEGGSEGVVIGGGGALCVEVQVLLRRCGEGNQEGRRRSRRERGPQTNPAPSDCGRHLHSGQLKPPARYSRRRAPPRMMGPSASRRRESGVEETQGEERKRKRKFQNPSARQP